MLESSMATPTVILRRTVRFALGGGLDAGSEQGSEDRNGFAGKPAMVGVGVFVELDVCCRCPVEAKTGYSLNIKVIDAAVRTACVPVMAEMIGERRGAGGVGVDPLAVLARVMGPLDAALEGRVHSVRWKVTPYYSVEMTMAMAERGRALMRQQFEFAAAHRLNVQDLSADENRAIFGKCNNPRGHGHNYKVEPCVEVPAPSAGPRAFTLRDLEKLTMSTVIDRFDHTHLNEDTAEFANGTGLNPSVENIAKVCFDLLAPVVAAHPAGARLAHITVWETDKTCCTYPA